MRQLHAHSTIDEQDGTEKYDLRRLPEASEGDSSPYVLVRKYPNKPSYFGKWRTYAPLEDTPDLFLRFARLYEKDTYKKFSRRSQDWAIVGVAAVVEKSDGGIGSARIGLTSMGSTPIRASATEQALSGARANQVAEADDSADEGASPVADDAASAEFRRHLARVWTRRAVEEALNR